MSLELPLPFLVARPVPDSEVTVEYCAKHNWLIGSPDTVAEKLEKVYEDVGGFGMLTVFGFDYVENPEAWKHSLELIIQEVAPKLSHLEIKAVSGRKTLKNT